MSDRDGLLLACLHAPMDDAPRLVFADWLDDHGELDTLHLAALRCDGYWLIEHPSGEVERRFNLLDAIGKVFPNVTLNQAGESAYYGSTDYLMRFGRVPDGGPICAFCRGATIGLSLASAMEGMMPDKDAKWKCNQCRRSNYSGRLSAVSGTIVVAIPPYTVPGMRAE